MASRRHGVLPSGGGAGDSGPQEVTLPGVSDNDWVEKQLARRIGTKATLSVLADSAAREEALQECAAQERDNAVTESARAAPAQR